jgi:hypothetical protein
LLAARKTLILSRRFRCPQLPARSPDAGSR